MVSKVIIIPPDDVPNNEVFNYTLPKEDTKLCHDSVLLEYCKSFNISKNNIQSLSNIGYVVIYTVDGEYLMFFTDDLSEKQLIYIKKLFEKEIKTAHLGFIQDEKMINVGKAKNFDEFVATYNSLKKEEKEYVR